MHSFIHIINVFACTLLLNIYYKLCIQIYKFHLISKKYVRYILSVPKEFDMYLYICMYVSNGHTVVREMGEIDTIAIIWDVKQSQVYVKELYAPFCSTMQWHVSKISHLN